MYIGLIRSSSLGDVVISSWLLPILDQLGATPIWFGSEPTLGLLRAAYPQLETIAIKGSGARSSQTLRALARCHEVIDLQGNLRSLLMRLSYFALGRTSYCSHQPRVWGSTLVALARLWGRKGLYLGKTQSPARLDLALKTLQDSLGGQRPPGLTAPLTALGSSKAPLEGVYLVVAMGASYPTKAAPSQVFYSILHNLQRLRSQEPLKIVLLGNELDVPAGKSLSELLGPLTGLEIINLTGSLSLLEAARLLAHARHVLSNDSGLAHLAEAVGTSVSVLFGPTVEAFGFAPLSPQSRAFSAPMGCRPCSKHGKVACRYKDNGCFLSIDLSKVSSFLATNLATKTHESSASLPEKRG